MVSQQPSALDDAFAQLERGQDDDALRSAICLLNESPTHFGAALLTVQQLLQRGRITLAYEGAKKLADAFVRRGDLPSAIIAADLIRKAGQDIEAIHQAIAAAFCKESNRLNENVQLSPPPFPHTEELPDFLLQASGEELLDQAENVLSRFLSSRESIPPNGPAPPWPLFSALDARSLQCVLGELSVRQVRSTETVIRQGEDAEEAFVVARGGLEVIKESVGETTRLAEIGPGVLFGEMALLSAAPRSASVSALQPSELLVLSRAALNRLADRDAAIAQELQAYCQYRMLDNLMRHSALFAPLNQVARHALIQRFEAQHIDAGQPILTRGKTPTGLYVIASGAVQVMQVDGDGESLVLAQLGPGDVVGEISMLLMQPTNADVVTTHPTLVLRLSHAQFEEVMSRFPELTTALQALAQKRALATEQALVQSATMVDEFMLI